LTLSILRRRSALPIVASLLVALLLPATTTAQQQSKKKKRGAAPAEPANPEAALADEGAIYILVDEKAMLAQIKVRGIALEVLPLKSLAFLDYQTAFASLPDRVVQLPALFTVEEDVNSVYRKYVAPEELITVEEAEKLEAERVAAVKAATEAAKAAGQQPPPVDKGEPPAEPERPTEYRIQLNEGWALQVRSEKPDRGFLARLKAAFHDGLARLRGEEVATPQLLDLTMAEDDARRIHRLLHPGLKILVIG
jgi:hypothetical protein